MLFQKILCPVDFSEPSHFAMRKAAQLAIDCQAALVVVHVWESAFHPQLSKELIQNELLAPVLEEQQAELEKVEREVAALGAKRVETKLLYGVPWHAIVQETRDDPTYDLVVMGTHGRTGIKHVLLGSVAERVARHANCPVLLVRPKQKKVG